MFSGDEITEWYPKPKYKTGRWILLTETCEMVGGSWAGEY